MAEGRMMRALAICEFQDGLTLNTRTFSAIGKFNN
jgi:hypothetical protein